MNRREFFKKSIIGAAAGLVGAVAAVTMESKPVDKWPNYHAVYPRMTDEELAKHVKLFRAKCKQSLQDKMDAHFWAPGPIDWSGEGYWLKRNMS